jgi:RimJ/RimL family protein N-acetyltransferase
MSAPILANGPLGTPRLLLRRPEPGDAAAIAAALGDYHVAHMLARVPQPYHLQDAKDWLATLEARDGDAYVGIVRQERLIGMIGLHTENLGIRLGYWLCRDHWGRGFATEALAAVLRSHLAVSSAPIRSGVFADNAASLRVQEKLGFRVVGRSEIFALGRNAMVDHIETELIASDFHRLHAGPVTSAAGVPA